MKFLCDVHISYKLVKTINDLNYECIHVNDILDKWFTSDSVIAKYADDNNFIIITKDADFRNSFFVKNTPKKLIKINLGNISNNDLILIFKENLPKIEQLEIQNSFIIEIDKESITFQSLK